MALFGRKSAKPPAAPAEGTGAPTAEAAAPATAPGAAASPPPPAPAAPAAPAFDTSALEGQLKRIAEQLTRLQSAVEASRAEAKEVVAKVAAMEEQLRTQLALSEALTQAFNPLSAAFRDGPAAAPAAPPPAPSAQPAPAPPATGAVARPPPASATAPDARPAPAPAPSPTPPGPAALPLAWGPDVVGLGLLPGGPGFAEAPGPLPAAAAVVAPLLPDLPSDPGATLAAMAWLDHLARSAGTEGATRLLSYYQSIGWLSADAHRRLLALMTGLPPRTAPVEDAALLELHTTSLRHLERLRDGGADEGAEAAAGWDGSPRAHGP